MSLDLRINDLATDRLEAREGADLVLADEAAVANHVGREDRRKPTFHSGLSHGLPLRTAPSRRDVSAFRATCEWPRA